MVEVDEIPRVNELAAPERRAHLEQVASSPAGGRS
jgi:hypothetical protein